MTGRPATPNSVRAIARPLAAIAAVVRAVAAAVADIGPTVVARSPIPSGTRTSS